MVLPLANTHLGLKSLMQKLKLRAFQVGLYSLRNKLWKLFKFSPRITTLFIRNLAHLCSRSCIAALKHSKLVLEVAKLGDGRSDQIRSNHQSLIIKSMSTDAFRMLTKRLNPTCVTNARKHS